MTRLSLRSARRAPQPGDRLPGGRLRLPDERARPEPHQPPLTQRHGDPHAHATALSGGHDHAGGSGRRVRAGKPQRARLAGGPGGRHDSRGRHVAGLAADRRRAGRRRPDCGRDPGSGRRDGRRDGGAGRRPELPSAPPRIIPPRCSSSWTSPFPTTRRPTSTGSSSTMSRPAIWPASWPAASARPGPPASWPAPRAIRQRRGTWPGCRTESGRPSPWPPSRWLMPAPRRIPRRAGPRSTASSRAAPGPSWPCRI